MATVGESRHVENTGIHIHARTIIAVLRTQAVNVLMFANLFSVIGAGSLAQSTAELLGDASVYIWFSSCISIIPLALMPPLSQIADYWGRRWVMLITSLGGIVGPLLVSRAQNVGTAIAGFCLLGVGISNQAQIYTIPSEVLHRKYRGWGQASANFSSGIGGLTGALMAGALVQGNAENFRIYWYTATGLFAIAIVGIYFGYTPPPRETESALSTRQKLWSLDWVGYVLLSPSVALISMALQWSGNPYNWANGHVLGPFIVGVVILIMFAIYEWYKPDGILHHGLFRHKNFPLAAVVIFLEGLTFYTCNAFYAYEITVVYGVSLFGAELRFIILFVGSATTSVVLGAYTTKTKQVREPMALGFILLVIFNAYMATIKLSSSVSHLWGITILAGLGLGLILNATMVVAQMATPSDMISVTTGFVSAVRAFGGSIGIAINNAILSSSLQTALPKDVAAAVEPLGFPSANLGLLIEALAEDSEAALAQVPGTTPTIIAAATKGLRAAYAHSFGNAWIAAACFAATGVIISIFITNPKAEFTVHIDAPVEQKLVELQTGVAKDYELD
ncbi:hypothetical protein AbraIFM66951_011485 [Aspergillus brasiliensis]|uniref:Major facilitator superfamily (MFS) profile domain-containing protein n=1 Tax=Aspergillus brasiliensis TaxID=319629 RepID=A0A9W5YV30_9EURO|nr:hypothetical protein AbraCBS73388_008766 [Aspergillus brasiliensis]GKZ47907.1 hypothetical protein AbraIFM66951_011485 [Aspergillus brasiliensis]